MSEADPTGPDEELSHELRRRVGDDFRAEAEEGERLAELARLRGRSLADLAVELRDRGDRVRLTAAGRTFLGSISGAGQDHCTLRTPAGAVEVPLPGRFVRLVVVEPHATEATDRRPYTTTFRSRMRELELEEVEVEIGGAGIGEPLRGRIAAVATDHLVVDDHDGARSYVAWDAIAYVIVPDGSGER